MSEQVIEQNCEQSPCKAIKKPLMTKQQQRKAAKIGMVGTLGVLTVSGLTDMAYKSKYVHAVAGVALLGFGLWHFCLNTPKKKK